jgi:hypothetical protein
MLGDYLTMKVDEDLCIGAHHPLVLLSRVQLSAIDAATQEGATLVLSISLITTIGNRASRGAQ